MDKIELISKAEELKESCKQAHDIDQTFYEELLDSYAINVEALKLAKDEYTWTQVLELQEQYDALEARLPEVSDEEFEEFILLGDFLVILLR